MRIIWAIPLAVITLLLFAQFGSCRLLESSFLHAPWRRECYRPTQCLKQACAPKEVWKSGEYLDVEENLVSYKERATSGDVSSQIALGRLYIDRMLTSYNQDEIEKFRTEAEKWWGKAAEQGDIEAQITFAYHMTNGEQPNEHSERAKWYLKAAEQGDRSAIDPLWHELLFIEGRNEDEEEEFWIAIDVCIGNHPMAQTIKHCSPIRWPDRVPKDMRERLDKRIKDWVQTHKIISIPPYNGLQVEFPVPTILRPQGY